MPCIVEDSFADDAVKKDGDDDSPCVRQDDDGQQEHELQTVPNKWLALKLDNDGSDKQQGLQLFNAAAGVRDDNVGSGNLYCCKVILDGTAEEFECFDGQNSGNESQRVRNHEHELFPHGNENAEKQQGT